MKKNKEKNTKIICRIFNVVAIVVACICLIVGIGISIKERNYERQEYSCLAEDIYYYEKGTTDRNACIITNCESGAPVVIADKGYVYLFEYDYYEEYDWDLSCDIVRRINKANEIIYDVEAKQVVQVLDFEEIGKEVFGESIFGKRVFWDPTSFRIRSVEGIDYIQSLYIETQEEECVYHFTYTNIETGETCTMKPEEDEEQLSEGRELYDICWEIMYDDPFGLLKNNGFSYTYEPPHKGEISMYVRGPNSGICLEVAKRTLPEHNDILYGEFPGLKEYEGSGDDTVVLYINRYLTVDEVLALFMEEGEEVSYEGCVLPARMSKDEKSHEIHSVEEYLQWRKE